MKILPRHILRLEGFLFFVAGIFVYAQLEMAWWLFVILFFLPDLGLLGYLKNEHWGSHCYNLLHTYLTPTILLLIGLMENYETLIALAVVWVAHIGFDRAIGFNLKSQPHPQA